MHVLMSKSYCNNCRDYIHDVN
uniref:Uncharacterized protein n=1 Tax=Lepeophtheirus salmonis TaxID=72036 RepID=A0A0K2UD72_LEPSM